MEDWSKIKFKSEGLPDAGSFTFLGTWGDALTTDTLKAAVRSIQAAAGDVPGVAPRPRVHAESLVREIIPRQDGLGWWVVTDPEVMDRHDARRYPVTEDDEARLVRAQAWFQYQESKGRG